MDMDMVICVAPILVARNTTNTTPQGPTNTLYVVSAAVVFTAIMVAFIAAAFGHAVCFRLRAERRRQDCPLRVVWVVFKFDFPDISAINAARTPDDGAHAEPTIPTTAPPPLYQPGGSPPHYDFATLPLPQYAETESIARPMGAVTQPVVTLELVVREEDVVDVGRRREREEQVAQMV